MPIMKIEHRHQIAFYSITVLLASIIGVIELPSSYFSNKYNPFNQYLAKYAWGWTVAVILPLLFSRTTFKSIGKGLAILALSTAYFVLSVKVINLVHHHTGTCSLEIDDLVMTVNGCKNAGGTWNGFDISGHCFLLVHSSLYIINELSIVGDRTGSNKVLIVASKAANVLLGIWWVMLIFTCFYFHDVPEALLGLWIGVAFWAIMFKYDRVLLKE